jgi:hypothetical protein
MDHTGSSFLSGTAVCNYLLLAAKERDDNAAKRLVRTNFFVLRKGSWEIFKESGAWTAIAMATFKRGSDRRVIVAAGPSGEIWECRMTPMEESTGALSADDTVIIRNLSVVEDTIYAVGMSRRVFRRDAPHSWTPVGPNAPVPQDTVAGFNDLAAASASEMYAVGWEGEIWLYDGKNWSQIDSPVSAHLRAACYAHDERIYAVGYNGTMVRGRRDHWEIIDTRRPENLMDVCAFDGKIYVVTDFEILVLTEEGLVPAQNFEDPDDLPATCLHLLAAPDGVFSMGPKDVFLLIKDTWQRVV